MSFPKTLALEIPILQELVAVGGSEDVRFLYPQLISYFPQLSEKEIVAIRNNALDAWRKLVQRAGRELDENGLLKRERGFWTITESGKRAVETETRGFVIAKEEQRTISRRNSANACADR